MSHLKKMLLLCAILVANVIVASTQLGDHDDLNRLLSYKIDDFNFAKGHDLRMQEATRVFQEIEASEGDFSLIDFDSYRYRINQLLFEAKNDPVTGNPEQQHEYLNYCATYSRLFCREKVGEEDRRQTGIVKAHNYLINNVQSNEAYEKRHFEAAPDSTKKAIFMFLDDSNFDQYNLLGHKLYGQPLLSFVSVMGMQKIKKDEIDLNLAILLKTLFKPDYKFGGTPLENIAIINAEIQSLLERHQRLRKLGEFIAMDNSEFSLLRLQDTTETMFKGFDLMGSKLNDIQRMYTIAFAQYCLEYFPEKEEICEGYYLPQEQMHEIILGDLTARGGIFTKAPSYDTLNGYRSGLCFCGFDVKNPKSKIIVIDDFTKKNKPYPKIGETSHGDDVVGVIKRWIGSYDQEFFASIIHSIDVATGTENALKQAYDLATGQPNRHYFINLSLHFGTTEKEQAIYSQIERILALKNIRPVA